MGLVFGQNRTDLIKSAVPERSKSMVFVKLTSTLLSKKRPLYSEHDALRAKGHHHHHHHDKLQYKK